MKDNSLQNIENYKKDSGDAVVSYNEMDIYMKYVNVINQYLLFGIETIKNKNSEYLKYILIKGLFTISHVFKMLLLFTQNLDLTYYHCQKSYSYYIEFIGQIGDDAVTYLQLNSKDAALFVYKKTIFDINQEYKKNYYETKTEEIKNNIVSMLIEMYNKIIETELTQLTPEQLQLKNGTTISKIHTNVANVNDKLYKLYYSSQPYTQSAQSAQSAQPNSGTHADNGELLYNKLKYIKQFCDVIISRKNAHAHGSETTTDYHCENYKDYIKIIEYFIKKIRKLGPIDASRLESLNSLFIIKYFSHEFEERIKMCNALKFINWIFLAQRD
uniref:Uncharacterized protein n=1 Tax=viral metagenome TaxID=1070528 RepID=A0A6C0EZ67_9ZZZZ